jgi:peptidoglycan/xylan/chitin deacetylase (PgdA/CDA1 family)
MSVRSTIKAIAEHGLVWSGATWVGRRRMSDRVLVLAYHNVVPDDAPIVGDRQNHLRLSSFRAQLATIAETHDVVPLSETLTPARGRSRPRIAITFDDAYRGAVVHAVPELARHGFPATIFVAPAFLGGRSFWWDAFATAASGLDPTLRAKALDELRGEDETVRAWARQAGLTAADVPSVQCAASLDELQRAAAQPGITLGSHTWSHPNLARLDGPTLEAELTKPRAWLREHAPKASDWIAYPYGSFSPAVAKAAAAAGYAAGLAIDGGWFTQPATDRFALPRVNIPTGMSLRGLELRAAGLLSQ